MASQTSTRDQADRITDGADDSALLDQLLEAAIIEATGIATAKPRDGQRSLAHDVYGAMASRSRAVGEAPTGVGKSMGYGAPAVLRAVRHRERTLISTESLTLQAQLIDKDAPTLARAASRVLGAAPVTAVLKGWANYACAQRLVDSARSVLLDSGVRSLPGDGPGQLEGLAAALDQLPPPRPPKRSRKVTGGVLDPGVPAEVTIDGMDYPRAEIIPLMTWALREIERDNPTDRHSYAGSTSEGTWSAVSVSPAECIGEQKCPFGDICRAARAREAAAAADIVITNHSMIAVQAAKNAAVVIGSRRIGVFRHVVIDEAHALPGQVRNQGACEISGRRIRSAVRMLEGVWDESDKGLKGLMGDGALWAEAIGHELTETGSQITGRDTVLRLKDGVDPLEQNGDALGDWLSSVSRVLDKQTDGHGSPLALLRAKARIEGLKSDLASVRAHRTGVARWVERGEETSNRWQRPQGPAVKSTPIDVGGLLANSVWTTDVPYGDDGDPLVPEGEWCSTPLSIAGEETADAPRYPLSVSAVSATLAPGFSRDAGLWVQPVDYPSPFDAAYAASMLLIPRIDNPEDTAALTRTGYSGKAQFDTARHPEWAAGLIEQLVSANGGAALVLAATASAGKLYVERLRLAHRAAVHSQWDGIPLRQVIAEWRADVGSVLVGTKSLMTGVDAPGETCTLVVVDRIPRAAGNPVDDARVEAITQGTGDKWAADATVYGGDAALLLEQAAGRLIRSMSDSGMVAVLDPRLLKKGPVIYPDRTRRIYINALRRFDRKVANMPEALGFLSGQRSSAAA